MGVLPTFRNKADVRTCNFMILYFYTLAVLWHLDTWLGWWRLPLWLVNTTLSFIGAVITHNSMHCSVFKERAANVVFQMVLTLTYGHPVSSYVPGHNLSHHKHTQLEKDIMRTTKVRFRWNLLNGLLFQPRVTRDVARSDFRYLRLQYALGRRYAGQCIRELWFLVLVMVTLAVLDVRKFFVYFWVPHFFAQWGIVSMNMLQHDGCVVTPSGQREDINSARNFVGSITNWLFLNNGYHTIHHIYPYMHWSKLPEAHAKEVAPFIHPSLDQANMATYIFKTFVYPGRREWYDGRPLTFDADHVEPPDKDWIDYEGLDPKDIDFSWAKAARFVVDTATLVAAKLVSPLYSPVHKVV